MSPVENFENEIFISYAHIDNQPLAEGLEGWVETLHERLKIRLGQLLGEEVRIWRDPKLQGNDVFADTLMARISNAAILVSILSPRYVKSDWCLKELNEFCRAAAQKGGIQIGDKLRIFKVVKTYIHLQDHPKPLQGSLGYEFFEYDQARGRAKEFTPDVTPTRDIRYWERLDDLAYDLKQLIEMLRDCAAPAAVGSGASTGKVIYLAETTSDLTEQRDKIKRELQQHGHMVLPDKELSLNGRKLVAEVREYIERSHLSIHLIGQHYGVIPEEEDRSVIHVQYDLAVERGAALPRVVWMPIGLEPRGEAQQRFVDHFRLGLNIAKGTEVLQTKLEDLKTFIQEELAARQEKPALDLSADGRRLSVYLMCDRQDLSAIAPVEEYLFNCGLDVLLPVAEGDEAQAFEYHKMNLLDCDAVIVYYNQANELWLRMKQRELQKVAGYGRSQPFLARAIYITGAPSDAKERIRDHDSLVIKSYNDFTPESLQPFLQKLLKSKGA